MYSKSLSKLVKEVFSNEEVKKQFISNPDSVMSQFKLTEQEKRAVLSTHARMALAGTGSAPGVALAEPLVVWL
jgi:hypothetical protein